MNHIYITSGTREFLETYRKKYQKHSLLLMENEEKTILLYESANEKSLFNAGNKYEVITSSGNLNYSKGVVVFHNIPVTEEGKPLFHYHLKHRSHIIVNKPGFLAIRALKPLVSDTYIIMTLWENNLNYKNWRESTSYFKDLYEDDQQTSYITQYQINRN